MTQLSVDRGMVVTYVDHGAHTFVRAVAMGPGLADPETDTVWIPLVTANCTVTLVDRSSIVFASADVPSSLRLDDPYGPVALLAAALDLLAAELIIAGRNDTNVRVERDLLLRFTHTVAPVEQALALLAESDPDSGLTAVLGWLSCAAQELECGNLGGMTSGVLIADSSMKRLLAEDELRFDLP